MATSSLSQMDSLFSSSLFLWLLIVVFLVFIKIPSCSSKGDWYTKCGNNFTCGSLTATYPFWGASRPSGCGIPELELTCDSHTTTITIKGVKYRVLEIRSDTRIIRIAREDFLDGICPPLFVNTSLDPPLLDYVGGYSNITFIYGCLNAPVSMTVPGTFHCVVSGAVYGSGYIFPGAIGAGLCYNSVYFPVTIATLSFIFSQTALDDGIRQGFEVEWNVVDIDTCSNCTSSKGVCGYDLNSKETTCYCPNQSNGLKICPAQTVADSADPGMVEHFNLHATGCVHLFSSSL